MSDDQIRMLLAADRDTALMLITNDGYDIYKEMCEQWKVLVREYDVHPKLHNLQFMFCEERWGGWKS